MRRLPGPLRFARMAGSSIANPSAAGWVTDFVNAAYYARPEGDRSVQDLRLAHGIIATRWSQLGGRRLGASDALMLHRAYGRLRLRDRGRLDGATLLHGARVLIGDWFAEAWADPERRAYGIAFPTVADRLAFRPERRLARAALGPLTPPRRAPAEQHWATYDAVALPDVDAALGLLADPARWPDIGSASGRFTPVRRGGLHGQTFEIEVVADASVRAPIATRGYVTCTTALTAQDGDALTTAGQRLGRRYVSGAGRDAPVMLPGTAELLALIVLTTHEGHFLGPALSQLLVWRDRDGAWIRDVGAWDPLAAHLAAVYRAAGRAAQREFWGPVPPQRSMLAQLAAVTR
jgi:hypothetical protein